MTAAVESPVLPRQRFTVTYTLLNDLQDFLAVRLVWTPEGAAAGGSGARKGAESMGRGLPPALTLSCFSPSRCREGAARIGARPRIRTRAPGGAGRTGLARLPHAARPPRPLTQGQRSHRARRLPGPALRPLRGAWTPGLSVGTGAGGESRGRCGPGRLGPHPPPPPAPPQLSQHMKLKLQFTASVSHPPPEARPVSRKSSPSSPAVRDLVERHQAGLGRSQSFSHQQPSRTHLMRYQGWGLGRGRGLGLAAPTLPIPAFREWGSLAWGGAQPGHSHLYQPISVYGAGGGGVMSWGGAQPGPSHPTCQSYPGGRAWPLPSHLPICL